MDREQDIHFVYENGVLLAIVNLEQGTLTVPWAVHIAFYSALIAAAFAAIDRWILGWDFARHNAKRSPNAGTQSRSSRNARRHCPQDA